MVSAAHKRHITFVMVPFTAPALLSTPPYLSVLAATNLWLMWEDPALVGCAIAGLLVFYSIKRQAEEA